MNIAKHETLVLESLKDKNVHVANSAAQFLINHGYEGDAELYWQTAKDTTLDWQVQTNLYRAANKTFALLYGSN